MTASYVYVGVNRSISNCLAYSDIADGYFLIEDIELSLESSYLLILSYYFSELLLLNYYKFWFESICLFVSMLYRTGFFLVIVIYMLF